MRARFRFPTLVATALCVMSCLAFAQAPEGAAPPESEAVPKLIPELNVNDVPFAELIEMLRKADPSFQAVVAYPPDGDRSGPIIQELKLKNVSAQAVLQLLAETYPLETSTTETEDDRRIWTIRVAGAPHRGGLYGGSGEATAGAERVTAVHRLREIVDELVADMSKAEEFRKQARDGVVSLLQTAIDTQAAGAGGGEKAVIKLHEPTETLVFKGTPQQAELVRATLDELIPPAPSKDAAEAKLRELRGELEKYRETVQALKQRVQDQVEGAAPSNGAKPSTPADSQPQKQPSK